ncbi:MAG: carboxypeptidase regulatory-like domain-containing protein [Planctomycetia bacterium]|nr:carboxypeptidase regulatory-like domain-containing protein [Planctomycetia bacterium]
MPTTSGPKTFSYSTCKRTASASTVIGVVVNEFPRLLRDEVERTDDPNLWVLSDCAPLERGHLATLVRQTIFGHFSSRALQGEADSNADRLLDIGELFRFVQANVAHWVADATAGVARQTPMLLCGRALKEPPSSYPVLLAVAALQQNEPKDAAKDAAKPAEPVAAAPAPAPPIAEPTATATPAPTIASPTAAATADAKPAAPAAPLDPNALPTIKLPDPALTAAPLPPAIKPLTVEMPKQEMKSEALLALGRQMQVAIEDRSRGAAVPVDFGPQWWRAARSEFRSLERMQADPSVDARVKEISIRRAVTSLGEFANGRPLTTGDEALRKLEALRGSVAPPTEELRTWALVERAVSEGAAQPSADLKELITALDAAFAADTSTAFDALAAKAWSPVAERYEEFHFARRLGRAADVSWTTRRLAWHTCREGERAGAEDQPRTSLQNADRLRETARREMFDQVDDDWIRQADRAFRDALELYRLAQRAADERRRSSQVRNDALYRASEYVRWVHDGEGDTICAPRHDDVLRFLLLLAEFTELLEQGPEASYDDLLPRRERLEALVAAIEAPLGPPAVDALVRPGSPVPALRHRIEVLLRSGLASITARTRLEEALLRLDADAPKIAAVRELPTTFDFARNPTPHDWRSALRFCVLVTRLSRLTLIDGKSTAKLFEVVSEKKWELAWKRAPQEGDQHAKKEPTHETDESSLEHFAQSNSPDGYDLRAIEREVRRRYAELTHTIEQAAQLAGDLTDPLERTRRLTTLRAARRASYLLDPRDVARLAGADVGRMLQRAEWYDLLVEARDRALLARQDSSNIEAAYLAAVAEDDRELAQKIPSQPPIAPRPLDPVRLLGPAELSLTDEPTRDLKATVEYIGPTAGPVWLIVHYDPDLFEVKLPPGSGIYEQHELKLEIAKIAADAEAKRMKLASAEKIDEPAFIEANKKALAARNAGRFPLEPAGAGLPATWSLSPGERKEVVVQLRRKGTAARRTKVVVNAVTRESYVRVETATTLPSLETISFAPVGGSGSWSRAADGVVLHPLPNRTTDYEFQVANLGTADKVVDVEFIAPEKRLATTLPNSVRTLAISEVLAMVGPAQTLVKIDDLKLPGGAKPVSLAAPKPKEKGEPPPKEADKNNAESTVGTGPKTGDEPPPIPVRQGILMILRERETGNTLLRRIDFRPQRPRRYMDAVVGYNLGLERIEVRVVASDRAAVPPAGVKVKLNFPEPLARGTEAQLEGIVNAPDYTALLYVQAPPSDSRVQTVYLNVDDYPRAFTYHVPCGPPATNIPEVADALELRILAPANGSMFKAPASVIPVELQVDAPIGSFDNDRDVLEVGIDRDRDRDFRDEAPLVLYADRQAEVFLNRWGTNGIVVIKTDVHDFKLEVPGGALQNLRANLVAKAQVGSRIAYSAPLEIGLDGAAPQISRLELKPGRTVAVGGELVVDAWSTDAEMSGTGKIEIGFDVDGSGKFSEKEPPLPALSVAPTRWSLKLPTDKLVPGKATVLVRATDRVGNVGEYSKLALTVVSAADAAALARAAGSRLTGTVRYGTDPLEKAVVSLLGAEDKQIATAESDAAGFFALEAVPAGTYKLTARGLAKNKPRKYEQPLTVPAPPAKVPRLDLQVE